MLAKIVIKCTAVVLTGLHIGASNGFSAIGAIDNPVIRDPYSGDPMIPGSSLKGKMRTLLAQAYRTDTDYFLPDCEHDDPRITRLFGTAKNENGHPRRARLQFCDAFLINKEEMLGRGGVTEAKSENTITRSTGVANPRTSERVCRGSKFSVTWFYSMDAPDELLEDIETLVMGCRLLALDYLGGGGTRGNGRIRLDGFHVALPQGECPLSATELEEQLKEVSLDAVISDL